MHLFGDSSLSSLKVITFLISPSSRGLFFSSMGSRKLSELKTNYVEVFGKMSMFMKLRTLCKGGGGWWGTEGRTIHDRTNAEHSLFFGHRIKLI